MTTSEPKDLAAQLEAIKATRKSKKKGPKEKPSSGAATPSPDTESTPAPTRKAKKVVITDMSEIDSIIKDVKPVKAAPRRQEAAPQEQGTARSLSFPAVLAPVGGQIGEAEIRRVLGDCSVGSIHEKIGYFIIEFPTNEDRKRALGINKKPYPWRTGISILIGEYDIADEHPEAQASGYGYGYGRSQGRSFETPAFQFGQRVQPPAPGRSDAYDRGGYDRGGYDRGGYDRGSYDRPAFSRGYDHSFSSDRSYRQEDDSAPPRVGLRIGGAVQPDRPVARQPPPPTRYQPPPPSGSAYVPPANRQAPPPQIRAGENKFGALQDDT